MLATTVFTDDLVAKVEALIGETKNPESKFRAYISGGGCSGFQYNFSLDDKKINDDDIVINKKIGNTVVTLLIDIVSYQYLKSATIDYKENFQDGGNFVIDNPAAKSKCGCGASFSV